MPVHANDDMVEHFDLEQLPRADEVAGDFDVRLARRGITAGVVVLCAAPVYVQLPTSGAGVYRGSMGKGVLCLTADHSSKLARTRMFAD